MPRCKIERSFIGDIRKRVPAFATWKKGIQKKAEELSVLCGVQVAVVCVYPDGAAGGERTAPVVWESEAGVFDRYLALPTETRAQHTHRCYLENELGKQKAKLARTQQDGPTLLTCRHPGLNDMTLDEVRELLEAIDAAVLATAERLEALGLPPEQDGYGTLKQIAPDGLAAVAPGPLHGHDHSGAVTYTGNNLVDMGAGFQLQMMAGHGNNHYDGGLEQFSRFQLHNAGMMQPGNDFQCTGGNYMGDLDGNYTGAVNNYKMQALSYGNDNYGYGWPHLTMWNQPGNAVLSMEYYPSLSIGGTPAPEQYPALGTVSSCINAPPVGFNMGNAGNFASPHGYAAHWTSPEELQHSGTASSWPAASP